MVAWPVICAGYLITFLCKILIKYYELYLLKLDNVISVFYSIFDEKEKMFLIKTVKKNLLHLNRDLLEKINYGEIQV